MKATIVFGIDMETDIGSWTPEYRGIREGTLPLLDLFRRHGIPCTFFWVGTAARENSPQARQVAEAGHEMGFHSLFHETVGDSLFPIPGVYPILAEELEHRLVLAKQMVREASGVEPTAFRAPRLFGGTNLVNVLERLGVLSDASYPMYYYQKQLAPYHPSREDWTQKGDLRIVEIPIFADLSISSHDEYGRDRDQWPVFRTESSHAVMEHVFQFLTYLSQHGLDSPTLCFYFHPWEFVKMPQGEIFVGEGFVRPEPFLIRNCGPYALEQMDALIGALKEAGFGFKTCREVAAEAG
jgi:peptidoglycan/xylan/chitin deacetylase (PgdA/CDA1 family)